ncbi:hypothetical protein [Microbacterium sp. cx-59]|uniref:hypothetical protein n=1 Tax=Microbacterium sp. cx-59 TaxID=2891207 RepID=UPI001E3CAB96|nr:hypothetical protein [Microbacterium sp. cx-59]MCC4908645.1 hypothetical protein [Microbacterium sp. cx-59]
MQIVATGVSKGRRGEALPETSLTYRTAEARLVTAETEQRPTVLGLIASGRMHPDTGTVTIDGRADAGAIRRRVALVDAPGVSDPASNVTVFTVISEELMFAGRPAGPLAASAWLHENGFGGRSRVPIADIAPGDRLRMLLELTVLRRGVEGIVLVSPDRHGGDPHSWWSLAEEFAGRGLAVLVIAGEASATVLDGRADRASHDTPTDEDDPAVTNTNADDADSAGTDPAATPADASEPEPTDPAASPLTPDLPEDAR